MAAIASLGELGRVVVVAVHVPVMLVVAVGRAEDSWADRAGEVVHVVLAVQGGYIGGAQGLATRVA